MKFFKALFTAFLFMLGAAALPASAGDKDPLFINMTADDPHRANMAITFGANQFGRGHPLTIFLNDKGVLLGARDSAGRYAEHQKKLAELTAKGATVLICPMCMKHYGVKEEDLLPGIKVGSPEATGAALFRQDTRTLTW